MLKVSCVDMKHQGTYTCKASNKAGHITTQTTLVVKETERAPEFVSVLSDLVANESEDIALSVKVSGHPKPVVNFYKENKRIQNIDGISIKGSDDGTWSIVIEDAGPPDSGVYECKALNDLGEVHCACDVHVNGILDIRCDEGKDVLIPMDIFNHHNLI